MTDQPSPVRVASWNLWWGFGPWQQRRDAIAAVLADARPDVCGLQEVWAGRGNHLAALLADQLGMHWTWTPSPAPCCSPGSRPRPARYRASPPSSPRPSASRRSAANKSLPCAGSSPPTPPRLPARSHRRPQRRTRRRRAPPTRRAQDRPGGARPGPGGRLELCRPQNAALDLDRRNPYVAATGEPSARIEYVLVGLPTASGAGQVRSVRRIGDQPVNGVWPSDHAGVLAELQPVSLDVRRTIE